MMIKRPFKKSKPKEPDTKPMTNFEYLKSLSLEEYAETRVDMNMFNYDVEYQGDFDGYTKSLPEAISEEIKWLQKPHCQEGIKK